MLLLMAVYWCTETLPLAVTSLIPLVLAPLLSINKADTVARSYLKVKPPRGRPWSWVLFVSPTHQFHLQIGEDRTSKTDTSRNCCAKPNPEYLTRLSAKVYSIFTEPFSIWALRLPGWRALKIVDRSLGHQSAFPLHKAENIEEFCQSASAQPDLLLIQAYIPDMNFLCSFHPYLQNTQNISWAFHKLIFIVTMIFSSIWFSEEWQLLPKYSFVQLVLT